MAYAIRTYGDPVLKTKAAPITDVDGKLIRLVDDMFATLQSHVRPMRLDGIRCLYVCYPIGFGDRRNGRMRAPGGVEALGEGFDGGGRSTHSKCERVRDRRLETGDQALQSPVSSLLLNLSTEELR